MNQFAHAEGLVPVETSLIEKAVKKLIAIEQDEEKRDYESLVATGVRLKYKVNSGWFTKKLEYIFLSETHVREAIDTKILPPIFEEVSKINYKKQTAMTREMVSFCSSVKFETWKSTYRLPYELKASCDLAIHSLENLGGNNTRLIKVVYLSLSSAKIVNDHG